MKWFLLVSAPVLLTGLVFFGPVINTPEKFPPSRVESKKDIPLVNSPSEVSYPGATGKAQTGFQTETDNNNQLLYKNIIVCIL